MLNGNLTLCCWFVGWKLGGFPSIVGYGRFARGSFGFYSETYLHNINSIKTKLESIFLFSYHLIKIMSHKLREWKMQQVKDEIRLFVFFIIIVYFKLTLNPRKIFSHKNEMSHVISYNNVLTASGYPLLGLNLVLVVNDFNTELKSLYLSQVFYSWN